MKSGYKQTVVGVIPEEWACVRHSFTSALANAGVAPEVRMKPTGHKSADTHRGYSHHEIETLRTAVEKVPKLTE